MVIKRAEWRQKALELFQSLINVRGLGVLKSLRDDGQHGARSSTKGEVASSLSVCKPHVIMEDGSCARSGQTSEQYESAVPWSPMQGHTIRSKVLCILGEALVIMPTCNGFVRCEASAVDCMHREK